MKGRDLSWIDWLGSSYQGDRLKFSDFQVYKGIFWSLGFIWAFYLKLVLPFFITHIIILTNICIDLIIFAGGFTIYLMSSNWATGSTPGGARASILRIGEGYRIQIGHNDVFLNVSINGRDLFLPSKTFEAKYLIVSTLGLQWLKMA